jgi:hypothetical protein
MTARAKKSGVDRDVAGFLMYSLQRPKAPDA